MKQSFLSRLQTYRTGSPLYGTASILLVHWAGPFVDGTDRFVTGRAPFLDRATAGAEQLAVLLLLSLRFLARIAGGCRTTIVVAVTAAVAGRCSRVVVVQHSRQGTADVTQLAPKSRAFAPSAFQLAV